MRSYRPVGVANLLAQVLLAVCAAVGAATSRAAPFEDSIAQRMLACTACHGEQGRAGPDGYYPRLAGKPAGYLYNQLVNFRDGRRHYGLMTHMVSLLSDAYMLEIAEHFAAQQLPYPPPAVLPQQPPAEVLARGEELIREGDAARHLPACTACHGDALTGVKPAFPSLLGLPVDYLAAQLGAWRAGDRRAQPPDCMSRIVERLTDGDAFAVVSWLASQPVPADSRPAPAGSTRQPVAPDLVCGSITQDGGGPR